MITRPDPKDVPPWPASSHWEIDVRRVVRDPGVRSGVRFHRQRWRDVQNRSPGAYWVRYWNWGIGLEAFGWWFRVWHYLERQP